MTRRILILDDIRSDGDIGIDIPHFSGDDKEPKDSVLIARTYTMAIQALSLLGPWDEVYLDHDLGSVNGKTGYDVILWLEERALLYRFDLIPKKLICISSNPAGAKRINEGWESIQKLIAEICEQ